MDPAGQIPAESLPVHLSALRRHFEISLYFLLLTGVLTLVSTGKAGPGHDFPASGCHAVQGLPVVAWKGTGNLKPHGHLADGRVLYFLPVRSLGYFPHAGGRGAESRTLRSLARDDSPDAVRHHRSALQRFDDPGLSVPDADGFFVDAGLRNSHGGHSLPGVLFHFSGTRGLDLRGSGNVAKRAGRRSRDPSSPAPGPRISCTIRWP